MKKGFSKIFLLIVATVCITFACLLSAGCGSYIFTFPVNSEWFTSSEISGESSDSTEESIEDNSSDSSEDLSEDSSSDSSEDLSEDSSSDSSENSSEDSSSDSSENSSENSSSDSSENSSENSSSNSSSSEPEKDTIGVENGDLTDVDDGTPIGEEKTLNEWLSTATGDAVYTVTGTVDLELMEGGVALGSDDVDSITIMGGLAGGTIHSLGNVMAYIYGNNFAPITFKNITFTGDAVEVNGVLQSAPGNGRSGLSHFVFGGEIYFENCTFNAGVCVGEPEYLRDTDTYVGFTSCEFNVQAIDVYAVWISNGETMFENCRFKGARAVKIHEKEYANTQLSDVVEIVSFENCQFLNITEKPALSIGTIASHTFRTENTMQDCNLKGCADWDDVGGYGNPVEGIDGFYEADVHTTRYESRAPIDFTYSNIEVDGSIMRNETPETPSGDW